MKIEKCPWCGVSAQVDFVHTLDRGLGMIEKFYVSCKSVRCHATGPWRKTEEGAIKAWNKLRRTK